MVGCVWMISDRGGAQFSNLAFPWGQCWRNVFMVVGLQRYGFFWLGRLWDSGADSGNWFVVEYLCGLGLNGRKSGVRLAGGWWFSTGS